MITIYHLSSLDSEFARDRLNSGDSEGNKGWGSHEVFSRYADITMGGKVDQVKAAWAAGEYKAVALISDQHPEDLDTAFRLTNHIEAAWTANDGVITLGPKDRQRSTSVGDLMEIDGQFHLVASFGFENLGALA